MFVFQRLWNKSNVVKAGPEGEPEKVAAHGSYGRTGRTNGRTDHMIIKEKLCYF